MTYRPKVNQGDPIGQLRTHYQHQYIRPQIQALGCESRVSHRRGNLPYQWTTDCTMMKKSQKTYNIALDTAMSKNTLQRLLNSIIVFYKK